MDNQGKSHHRYVCPTSRDGDHSVEEIRENQKREDGKDRVCYWSRRHREFDRWLNAIDDSSNGRHGVKLKTNTWEEDRRSIVGSHHDTKRAIEPFDFSVLVRAVVTSGFHDILGF